jgi:Na+/citrate or Na+/malate symporter
MQEWAKCILLAGLIICGGIMGAGIVAYSFKYHALVALPVSLFLAVFVLAKIIKANRDLDRKYKD